MCLAGFLGSMVTCAVRHARRRLRTVALQLGVWTCLHASKPIRFNGLFRQPAAVSLLRHRVAPCGSSGILTASAIAFAVRLRLRTRLTPGRLALPGKPWSCGGRGSRPPSRYLYLHLLFHALQDQSPSPFKAHGILPYRYFSKNAIPRLRCLPYTRLLSTHGPSTSELLRTL